MQKDTESRVQERGGSMSAVRMPIVLRGSLPTKNKARMRLQVRLLHS